MIDAELDAAELRASGTDGAQQASSGDASDGASPPARLWWEDDPELAHRFSRR